MLFYNSNDWKTIPYSQFSSLNVKKRTYNQIIRRPCPRINLHQNQTQIPQFLAELKPQFTVFNKIQIKLLLKYGLFEDVTSFIAQKEEHRSSKSNISAIENAFQLFQSIVTV